MFLEMDINVVFSSTANAYDIVFCKYTASSS